MADHGRATHGRPPAQPDPDPSYRLGPELLAGTARPIGDRHIRDVGHDRDRAACRPHTRRDVTVPDRLSIVGFDDLDIAAFTIPPLTTVSQSGVEMGRRAASRWLDMIETERSGADQEM